METIHITSTFNVGFEVTPAKRLVPPTDEDMIPILGEDGQPVTDAEGNVQQMPREGWEPTVEDVELPTLIFADLASGQAGNGQVFKFACDPETLGNVLAYFSQYLDADGRNKVREMLNRVADIVVPSADVEVPGLNRAQRRALERVK